MKRGAEAEPSPGPSRPLFCFCCFPPPFLRRLPGCVSVWQAVSPCKLLMLARLLPVLVVLGPAECVECDANARVFQAR